MCEPTSLIAGATAISMAGSLAQGLAQSQAASANASLRRSEAAAERERARLDEVTFRSQTRRQLGQQIVDQIAAGSSPSVGTSLDQAFRSTRNAEIDALKIRTGGENRARALENRARFSEFEGQNAVVFSGFSAAANLLRGGRRLRALE